MELANISTMLCLLLLAGCSISSAFDLYPPPLTSQDSDTELTSVDDHLATVTQPLAHGPYYNTINVTAVVKEGVLKKLVGLTTNKKAIHLKRSGDCFVLPIFVGSQKSELDPEGHNKYSVQLDVSSATTFLFNPQVMMSLRRHEDFVRSPSSTTATRHYYAPSHSKTSQPVINAVSKRKETFYKEVFDGGLMKGITVKDTVRVGGITMKDTVFGLIHSRSRVSNLERIDITGDGTLGLGINGRTEEERARAIFNAMGRNSKTMRKKEMFSIYICSSGQAGQLLLGGVDKSLLSAGTNVEYVQLEEIGQYSQWAVNLASVDFHNNKATIQVNQVAMISSVYPYILVPQKIIEELLGNVDSIQWPRKAAGTVLPPATATRRRREKRGPRFPLPTIHEPPPPRYAPMILCSEQENIGTLKLVIGGGISVSLTGSDLVGVEVEDQETYPDMCELLFAVRLSTASNAEVWRLGVPFLQASGMTVFDKKNMRIGFQPAVKHSDKICGPVKETNNKKKASP